MGVRMVGDDGDRRVCTGSKRVVMRCGIVDGGRDTDTDRMRLRWGRSWAGGMKNGR